MLLLVAYAFERIILFCAEKWNDRRFLHQVNYLSPARAGIGAQSSDDTFGTDASLVANHVKSILDSKGSGAAVAEIHKLLDNANQRKSIM